MKNYITISTFIFVLCGCATTSSQEELQQTWEAAHIRLLYEETFVSGKLNVPINQVKLANLPQGVKFPIVKCNLTQGPGLVI